MATRITIPKIKATRTIGRGRPSAVDLVKLVNLWNDDHRASEIASECECSEATVYRLIRQLRQKQEANRETTK